MAQENCRISGFRGEDVDCQIQFFFQGEEKGFSGAYLDVRYEWAEACTRICVGLGEKGDFGRIQCKEAFARAVKEAKHLGRTRICLSASKAETFFGREGIFDAVEGCILGLFEPEQYREKKEHSHRELFLDYGKESTEKEAWIQEAVELMRGVCFARHLVNRPGNMLTPALFAEALLQEADGFPVEVEILDETQIQSLGMEALLSVGNSSAHPPRLIILRYTGDPASGERYGYIGKGVTCDTGGYCLKPAASMMGIKGDMAGAAAAAGAICAMASNGVKANVTVVIPACENRISRESFLPGDVIGSMSGKTIEIGNTDAEGRLILADAITYAAQKEQVTKILDVATLTGAVVSMFGFTTAGAMANDDAWYETFERAAGVSAEQYWRLPAFKEYRKMVESRVAHVKNVSSGGCGTITAGLFLETFANPLAWIHLDIAGTAWVDSPIWEFQSAGATGAAVTTLYFLGKEQERKE